MASMDYFKINKIRPTATTKSCDMFEDKCVWSALYPISNHSHIRQLQLATHAFSQQVLQQAVQISICQCAQPNIVTEMKHIQMWNFH